MCFDVVNSGPAKIASKDILVWKILEKNNHSPLKRYKYVPNKEYKLKGKFPKFRRRFFTVERGFHAYVSRSTARFQKQNNYWNSVKIVKMWIPKDSMYYENSCEIVSNCIRTGDLKSSH